MAFLLSLPSAFALSEGIYISFSFLGVFWDYAATRASVGYGFIAVFVFSDSEISDLETLFFIHCTFFFTKKKGGGGGSASEQHHRQSWISNPSIHARI